VTNAGAAAADAGTGVFAVSAIAFDLDGTLLDTIHDLAAAVNALLAELGYPPLPKDTVRALVGKGIANLIRRALAIAGDVPVDAIDADTLADALTRYQRHYASALGRETLPFPGMAASLARLRAMGFPLALVTNKADRFVRPHLEHAGIAGHFALIIGGDTLPTRKPDAGPLLHVAAAFGIAPARLLMVGDSINDVQAARAAGCPVLVLPHGYNEGLPVHSLDADGIVPTLAALADRVRRVDAPVRSPSSA
jgi:phosphoglycolate phosphatase